MIIITDTETNKTYRIAGSRPPEHRELYLTPTGVHQRLDKSQVTWDRLILREVTQRIVPTVIEWVDKPGQERPKPTMTPNDHYSPSSYHGSEHKYIPECDLEPICLLKRN